MPLISGTIAALGALGTAAAAAPAVATAAAGAGGLGAVGATGGLLAGVSSGLAAGVGTGAAATTAGGITAGQIASAAAGAGTLLGVAGTGAQMYQNAQAVAAQKEQERLRQKQMQLESARAQREVIRKSMIARATGVNAAAQSGAELGSSSTYGGIIGQAATNEQFQLTSIRQNEDIGNKMFAANTAEAEASSGASLFGAVGNLGNMIANNNVPIGRIGKTFIDRTSIFK